MNTIEIHCSEDYQVVIGNGVIQSIDSILRQITKAEKVCIVSDSNVWPLYGAVVCGFLKKFQVCSCVFPAGEESKRVENYLSLLNFLAGNHMTRSDCIIALGGGVVGDLAGFAAATYLRGIPYMQIPTTLLAMVDSSVGGKTGIDLESGKNLVGAFHQPAAVLCDTDMLRTLPLNIFRDGCAEVIKYGILYDAELFSHLESSGLEFDREFVITRCIEMKRNAVAADEFDQGQRKLLNLGHTVGHAIEKCSEYRISHGKAVAIGMATVCRAADIQDTGRIIGLMEKFDLPVKTNFTAAELSSAAYSDKKRSGSSIDLIVPCAIGHCQIVPTSIDELQAFIEKGL